MWPSGCVRAWAGVCVGMGANEVVVWVTNGRVGEGEDGGGVSSPRDSDKCASY